MHLAACPQGEPSSENGCVCVCDAQLSYRTVRRANQCNGIGRLLQVPDGWHRGAQCGLDAGQVEAAIRELQEAAAGASCAGQRFCVRLLCAVSLIKADVCLVQADRNVRPPKPDAPETKGDDRLLTRLLQALLLGCRAFVGGVCGFVR